VEEAIYLVIAWRPPQRRFLGFLQLDADELMPVNAVLRARRCLDARRHDVDEPQHEQHADRDLKISSQIPSWCLK